jgi:hypothetical protein
MNYLGLAKSLGNASGPRVTGLLSELKIACPINVRGIRNYFSTINISNEVETLPTFFGAKLITT